MNLYFGTMNLRNNEPSEQWTPISDKWPFGPINLRHNKPFFRNNEPSEQWTFGTMNLRKNGPSEKRTVTDLKWATYWKKLSYRRLRIKSAYLQNWQFWLFQIFWKYTRGGTLRKNIGCHGNVATCLWPFFINAYLQLLNLQRFKNAYVQDLKSQKFESVIYEES